MPTSDPSCKRFTRLAQLIEAAKAFPPRRIAVAAAHEMTVIRALKEAQDLGLARQPLLFGRAAEIRQLATDCGLEVQEEDIIGQPDDAVAAREAAQAVCQGHADILMKGRVHSDDFLRGVLSKESGLRTAHLMSHCFVLEHPREERLLIVTDAGMNIAPTLEQKAAIALNAIYLAELLGIEEPRVAALAGVELVNPAMPATLDAAALGQMSDRRQFSTGIVDGPLAMDNAVSTEAACIKGIESAVAGRADILLVPDIEAGNIMVKTYSFLCGGEVAGVVVGAAAPVVLTSRADSAEAKLNSIALAVQMANLRREERLKIGHVHY
ncbi:MAG TPA: bifunctional enoyl-CoA hydratase/phosphate acetyltransferase [Armatimonadota bacterium]|nr:bifunctional enoyl-CoA hydratase/phosphate acetyltransferase [Armatimonadota bacterium]